MTHPTKVTQTDSDQMSKSLPTCGCGIQVQCQHPHYLLWKGGGWEEGREGREEKEGQGEAMKEKSGMRKVRVRKAGGVEGSRTSLPFPRVTSWGPVSLEIP